MYIESTLLVGLTFGIFASLGIGQWDNYRPPRKWLLLLIPVIAMTFLSVTDESRHFMFYIIPDEPQPNLNFHPNVGLFLMVGLAIALMIVRIFLIYRRNRIPHYTAQPLPQMVHPVSRTVSYRRLFLHLFPGLAGAAARGSANRSHRAFREDILH